MRAPSDSRRWLWRWGVTSELLATACARCVGRPNGIVDGLIAARTGDASPFTKARAVRLGLQSAVRSRFLLVPTLADRLWAAFGAFAAGSVPASAAPCGAGAGGTAAQPPGASAPASAAASGAAGLSTAGTPALGPAARNALAAVTLAMTYPLWVRRRKWTISYLDDTTIRQRQSVDFRWPQEGQFGPSEPVAGQELLVPLTIASKVALNDLDVFDEDGRSLSHRNRFENGRVAALGVTFLLTFRAIGSGIPIADYPDLAAKVEAIVTGAVADAVPLLTSELDGAGDLARILSADDEFRGILADLARGFMVLVPLKYEPGASRIIKLQHQTPNYWHGREGDHTLIRYGRSALASVGWIDKRQAFNALSIGRAGGTHFQIEAPEEVELSEAALTTRQYIRSHGGPAEVARRRVVFDQPTASLNVSMPQPVVPGSLPLLPIVGPAPTPAHVAASDRRRLVLRGLADDADVDVRLRPPARGAFAAITLVTAMSAVLLHLARSRLAELDGQTSAALLLALPVFLTAYLARPGEHAFVSRLLGGARLLGFVGALCALAVTALIASGDVRQQAAPTASPPVRCTVTSTLQRERGMRARRERVVIQSARCSAGVAAPKAAPKAREGADRIAWWSAWITTIVAVALLFGLSRTWWADVRRRNRPDETSPIPSAPAVSSVASSGTP